MPAERRAALAFVGDAVEEAHQRLRSHGVEAFFLSTCLRVEIAVTGDERSLRSAIRSLYGVSDTLVGSGTLRHGGEGFLHLCRVAAGLESPVVGELEVLAQFRSAVAAFEAAHPEAALLKRILDGAVAVGRAARRRTGLSPQGSLAAVAAREARRQGRVAIFGSGAMARAAAEELFPVDVTVFSRRPVRVGTLSTCPWEGAFEALTTFPTVISTVPGGETPLPSGRVVEALLARRDPLLLIDLGMPPGFEHLPQIPLVRYLTIDDVAARAGEQPSDEIEAAVTDASHKTWNRLSAPDRARSVIASLVDQAESAVDEEVSRFARRLESADDPEAILRQVARTVARRILHGPISYIGDSVRHPGTLDVMAEAFGVDE